MAKGLKYALRLLMVGVILVVGACSKPLGPQPQQIMPIEPAVVVSTQGPATSLKHGSMMHALATHLDAVATHRSSSLQDVRSLRALQHAAKYGRYPKVMPGGYIPLTGSSDPALTIAVSQMIWDGGRMTAKLNDLEHQELGARLVLWAERNEAIHDGLAAYTDILELREKQKIYRNLAAELERLSDLLQTRVEGGVADRGEVLRIGAAVSEVELDILSVNSSLDQAQSELALLLGRPKKMPRHLSLQQLNGQCVREWPKVMPPQDAIALSRVHRAVAAEELILARRVPTVAAEVGSNLVTGTLGAVGLRIDAGDMLGFGRKAEIEAAVAQKQAAQANFKNAQEDTHDSLLQLQQVLQSYDRNAAQLARLRANTHQSIELYSDQLNSSAVQIADGIELYRNRSNISIDLVEARAKKIRNCLETARIRGALTAFNFKQKQGS